MQQLQLHPCLFTAIWLGLTTIQMDTQYLDIINEVPPALQPPILQQMQIGWDPLYQGCISLAWANAINTLHLHLAMTGEQVMIKITEDIWTYILDIWKLQNGHLHNNATQMNLPNYKQVVITLYKQSHQLTPAAQTALYQQPLETVLEYPTPKMQTWVTHSHNYFNQQLKLAK